MGVRQDLERLKRKGIVMERLTHGTILFADAEKAYYKRLKAYEDTGLAPEEIIDGRMLTGWIDGGSSCQITVEASLSLGNAIIKNGMWSRTNFTMTRVLRAEPMKILLPGCHCRSHTR